jgi:hypothetical protein
VETTRTDKDEGKALVDAEHGDERHKQANGGRPFVKIAEARPKIWRANQKQQKDGAIHDAAAAERGG